jgi:Parvulin-like peptidyl-prolyl isomerase
MENKVLAKVGDTEITQTDVQFVINNLDPNTRQQFNSEDGQKRVVEELVNQELFYLDAMKNGIDNDEDFVKQLEKAKADLLKQYYITKLLSKADVDDVEIFNFYGQNREMFVDKEEVRARHILVSTEEEANKVVSEINSGLSFADAAKKYSSCPSSQEGGDLGFFSAGQMVPEFEKAAFSLKTGEMSAPVKTQFGYHIILTEEKKPAGIMPYDKAKEMIRQHLSGQRQQDIYYRKIDQLKKQYKVTINVE